MQVGVAGSALNHRSKELSFGIATIEPASLAAWRCPPLVNSLHKVHETTTTFAVCGISMLHDVRTSTI
jgi:hypothetical protein